MKRYKPFTTTLIGSMPRSKELLDLKDKLKEDSSLAEVYDKMVYEDTEKVLRLFENVGIDVVVSGEISRDNYMSYVAEHVSGIELMNLEDIKKMTEDSDEFNKSLEDMDASDNTMNSPICIGKIDTDTELAVSELKLIKEISDKDFKITLPSPYLLTRSMWLQDITSKVYKDKKALGEDVVKLLINEIRRLVKLGAKIIQLDEPILSEVVFTGQNASNSFY